MLPNLTRALELRMRSNVRARMPWRPPARPGARARRGAEGPRWWRAAAIAALWGLGALLAPAIAGASPHSPVVVVLGVQQEGKAVARARSAVTQHLLHMGESVLAPALSADDLLCTGADCLQRLARTFRADRLVGGEILPNDRNYIIRLWMFDVAQQQPSSAEEHCVDCTLEQVYELAASSAGKLLDAAPVPPLPPPPLAADAPGPSAAPSPPASSLPPGSAAAGSAAAESAVAAGSAATAGAVAAPGSAAPIAPSAPASPSGPGSAPVGTGAAERSAVSAPRSAARCTPRFYTFGRGVAAGALGGLTALGLASAIGLSAADGSVYLSKADGYPGDITWNFRAQYQAAAVLTALTAASLGATLIDWRKLAGHGADKTAMCESRRSKWTFNRGLAIGAFAGLLASGLATSVALTALDGGSYVSDDPTRIPTAIPYNYKTAYSVGYAASAGLALGLGLAVFLP